ncbi:MAG: 50S ribosomal protein L5, partial [Chloroflexota bacterium]|nr:50S ribosomal protein L5 [Chloroflexota bacterium]
MAKPDQAKPEAKKEQKPKGADAKAADAKGAPKDAQKARRPKSAAPPRLKARYRKEILQTMMREFGYHNVMQAPKVQKVIVNIGVGEAISNAKALDGAVRDMTSITGQKPLVVKAKKSIATYK